MSSSKADKSTVTNTGSLPEKLQEYISNLENENRRLNEEKKSLLSRLSQVAGVRMTEDNPNIADLSDINRPINLGEEFSQIYDDEYTEVYVHLERRKESIRNIQNKILWTAERCLQFCESLEKKQFGEIMKAFQLTDVANRQSLPPGVIKHVKELRTSLLKSTEANLEKDFITSLKSDREQSLLRNEDDCIRKYISKCVSFFWRACIQTPPLKFEFNVPPGAPFDSAVHRKCTVNGNTVAYTVWPVVYLHENGPVLVKGVVQCEVKPTDTKKGGGKSAGTPTVQPQKL